MTDSISDFLTRISNAIKANHRLVEIPASKMKQEMTRILFEKGYILNYKVEKSDVQGTIKIALKYHPVTKTSAIRTLTRVSKPGLRKYAGVETMPKVMNGLGIAIVSTSKGLMTGTQAKQLNVGGEVICYVY